jgi:hypothetical protein
MSASVSVGPGQVVGEEDTGSGRIYNWSFVATVNGATGICSFWYPNENPTEAADFCRAYLEEHPNALGGIS